MASPSSTQWCSRTPETGHRRQLELCEAPASAIGDHQLERAYYVHVPDAGAERQGAVAGDEVDPVGPDHLLHRGGVGAAPVDGPVRGPCQRDRGAPAPARNSYR